jgi:hypothetical protein
MDALLSESGGLFSLPSEDKQPPSLQMIVRITLEVLWIPLQIFTGAKPVKTFLSSFSYRLTGMILFQAFLVNFLMMEH